ncbi:lipid A export ATP-binding/permease MsbA [Klebsiella pneumoniae]|uniref:Lipid A export ATP-binding/permease MsbA n=1 Tax=Klebsiella pneumoniae TaxID=573 RepID=A0A2X3GQ97_KLEPN|nr:lipid A export ATP-binding/permease MsbA [Klebsiella pneumoniae]
MSVAIRVVSKRFRNISKNMQNTMGQVTTSAEQMLKGHKEVLMFGGQEVETKRFDKVSNKMRLQGMKMVPPRLSPTRSFSLSPPWRWPLSCMPPASRA